MSIRSPNGRRSFLRELPGWSQGLVLHSRNGAGTDMASNIQSLTGGELLLTPARGQVVDSGWGFRIAQASAPSSSHAACAVGQIQWDAGNVYVCVASGYWRRALLTDF